MPPDPAAAAEPAISLLGPQVYPLWLGFSFVVGLLWGSFFNVCIYRAPIGLSPTRPRRSFCFSCGTPIAWFDNIPLLSWLWLRGRCRHCGSRISPRYFVIELLTGALFALLWWSTNRPEVALERGFSAAVFWYAAVAGMLLIGAMTDIDHWIIPTASRAAA
jgi:leader peptidase (prepilin peptidase)/N-methyltransferase